MRVLCIVHLLLNAEHRRCILQGSKTAVPHGAQILRVDYTDTASLKDALRGVNVVISAISTNALLSQFPLAEAAKAAGVKLFVPSEFGNPTTGDLVPGFMSQKSALHSALRKLGLPYSLFFTCLWPDYCFVP